MTQIGRGFFQTRPVREEAVEGVGLLTRGVVSGIFLVLSFSALLVYGQGLLLRKIRGRIFAVDNVPVIFLTIINMLVFIEV